MSEKKTKGNELMKRKEKIEKENERKAKTKQKRILKEIKDEMEKESEKSKDEIGMKKAKIFSRKKENKNQIKIRKMCFNDNL